MPASATKQRPIEYKSIPVNLKDLDAKSGIITGYWSSFGVKDDGGDIVVRGAFAKSIQERGPQSRQPRIKFLLQHEPFYVLGIPQVLKEDDFGLYFESKILQTSYGKDTLVLYEGGAITEHSIGYETVKADKDPAQGARLLKELLLWEGSGVTWGMNSLTPVTGVKSRDEVNRLADQMGRVERILKDGSLGSDELCERLELSVKQWRAALTEWEPAARAPEVITVAPSTRAPMKQSGKGAKRPMKRKQADNDGDLDDLIQQCLGTMAECIALVPKCLGDQESCNQLNTMLAQCMAVMAQAMGMAVDADEDDGAPGADFDLFDRLDAIWRAVRDLGMIQDGDWSYPRYCVTAPRVTHVIIEDRETDQLFKVTYAVGDDGAIILGALEPVQIAFLPKAKSRADRFASLFATDTKAGRRNSTTDKQKISDIFDGATGLMDQEHMKTCMKSLFGSLDKTQRADLLSALKEDEPDDTTDDNSDNTGKSRPAPGTAAAATHSGKGGGAHPISGAAGPTAATAELEAMAQQAFASLQKAAKGDFVPVADPAAEVKAMLAQAAGTTNK